MGDGTYGSTYGSAYGTKVDLVDAQGKALITRAIAFLAAFANANIAENDANDTNIAENDANEAGNDSNLTGNDANVVENANVKDISSPELVAGNIRLIMPTLSSMSENNLANTRSTFEGASSLKGAATRFRTYVHHAVSQVICITGHCIAFEPQINRKMNISTDYRSLCTPFMLVSTNLSKLGLSKELVIHGMMSGKWNSENQLIEVKLYMDVNQLNNGNMVPVRMHPL